MEINNPHHAMKLADLKPQSKQLVYDLVTEAGVETDDWANYRRPEAPASNPKYCYNWSFEGLDRVVLCLWFGEMRQDDDEIFQIQNYREIAASPRHWNAAQRSRAAAMDHAIQLARNKRLPIRVIVVDGSRRSDGNDETRSYVERRLLDPEPWHVAAYDDDGNCRLQRGAWPEVDSIDQSEDGLRRLARISFNSSGWQHPTGDARKYEAPGTYNFENGFGHEDWLFRNEWVIDGWRYAFIQGLNNESRLKYHGLPLDITLYTIEPDKRRRLVATIYGLESLNDTQSAEAVALFKSRGWLKTMFTEATAAGGQADALGDPQWAKDVLNVRFRSENVELHLPGTYLPNDEWIQNRHRYKLYNFEAADRVRIEKSASTPAGSRDLPVVRPLFRRGTKPVEYTPEHGKMQARLMAELRAQYGEAAVKREQDYVDVRVETESELIYFEIKTDVEPRAVIRQALGQLLEYAYHPLRVHRRPNKLVIVGRTSLGAGDKVYLETLQELFDLPVTYRVVEI